MRMFARAAIVLLWFGLPASLQAQGDSVTIRLINTELRAAVQVMAQYLDRPVIFSGGGAGGQQVTVETPVPIPRAAVLPLLRGVLETHNYELVTDTAANIYRARPRETRPAPTAAQPPTQRPAGTPELFVIQIKHARAADVAATVNALYGRTTAAEDARGRVPTLGDQLRMNQVPPGVMPVPQQAAATVTRPATLTGDVTIVPDGRVNSLLIRANRPDYELILAAVQQLDVPPLQVLIEAIVVEVRRDRQLGLSAEAKIGPTEVNKAGTAVSASTGGPGLGDFAIKVMGIAGLDLEATIRIAAQRGDVRIVSRPVILTENNQEASIVVGSQRPFVQVARALPTDAPIRDQIVQYKEVGTKLTVRPTISADGFVQLDVMQEVSSATGEVQFDAPVISQRSIQTQLLVKDSQTVVLGGLTDRQRDVTSGGIPVLSAIPIIGGLFGRHSRRTTETELFIFLTPRVIRNEQDAERYTRPLRDRANQVNP